MSDSLALAIAADCAVFSNGSASVVGPLAFSNGSGPIGMNWAENAVGAVYVPTMLNAIGVLSFSLSGVDAASFSVNASTGSITFNAVPDYEMPVDGNGGGGINGGSTGGNGAAGNNGTPGANGAGGSGGSSGTNGSCGVI